MLGYGNRFCIWVQGCDLQCNHCIAPDSWSKNSGGYYLSIDELVAKIINVKNISGITISGGEPFLQSECLIKLLDAISTRRKDLDYIIYTGLNYDKLILNNINKTLIDKIDLLIDGEYIDDLNDGTPLIGSSNQGVYILTDAGYKLAKYMKNKDSREIEFLIKDNDIFMVGIPPKNIEQKIKDVV